MAIKTKKYLIKNNDIKKQIILSDKLHPSNRSHQVRKTLSVKKLAILAILLALGVVLKFFSIGNGEFRISLWDIPLFLAGIIAGPIYGGIVAMGADVIYGLCFSPYPFSFIMMFTTIVWGVAGGIFSKKGIKKVWLLFVVVLLTSVLATFINSIYLTLYYGFSYMIGMLPIRLLVLLIKWPITTLLVLALYKISNLVFKKE